MGVEAEKKPVTQEVAEDTSQYRKSWVTCWPNTHKHNMHVGLTVIIICMVVLTQRLMCPMWMIHH